MGHTIMAHNKMTYMGTLLRHFYLCGSHKGLDSFPETNHPSHKILQTLSNIGQRLNKADSKVFLDKSSYFYLLGPLQLNSGSGIVYVIKNTGSFLNFQNRISMDLWMYIML